MVPKEADDGNLDHMLDDFIFAGKANSLDCHTLVNTFEFL